MGCAALESGNLVEPVVGSDSLEAGELQMTVEAAAEHAERAQGPCSAELAPLSTSVGGRVDVELSSRLRLVTSEIWS